MTTYEVPAREALPQDSTQWDDLYIRKSFDDTGIVPTGNPCTSPDVIPAGLTPFSDPTQLVTVDANWTNPYTNYANARQPNYVYVRGRSLASATTTARMYAYGVPASAIMWPHSPPGSDQPGWADTPIKTQQGGEYVTIKDVAAGARFVTPEPFQWIPDNIVSSDHYCLCARLTTPAHPNPVPQHNDLNDFASWLAMHPNIGWRNICLTPATSPIYNFKVNYAQGVQGGDMIVQLTCENCPDGSLVAVTCDRTDTTPPLELAQTTVKNTLSSKGVPTFRVDMPVTIPDNWAANITITYWTNGLPPMPSDAKLSLAVYMPEGAGWDPALERHMRPIEHYGMDPAQIGPKKAMQIGGVHGQVAKMVQVDEPKAGVIAAADAAASSFSLAGFAWEDRSSSVIDQLVVPHDLAIQHVAVSGVDTEVLRLTGAPKQPGADIGADLTFDVAVAGAPPADTIFSLVSRNVPVGCEIWFKSVAGPVDFSVAPTKVTQENEFSVAADAELPAGYAGTVRALLLLNGNVLPPDWSLQLMAIQPPPTVVQEGPSQAGNGGPIKAKLIGSVTAKR